MRTIYNMALMNVECPKDMTERDCPLRQYLNSPASALRISINETLLMPKTENMEEICRAVNEMRQMCYECHKKNVIQR